MFLTAQKLNHDHQSVLNKKKRKLLRPTATLSDKPFLLTSCAQNTPSHTPAFRASKSASTLCRQHLTYTPITRRMLQKQQFVSHKSNHLLPMPSISDESNSNHSGHAHANMSPLLVHAIPVNMVQVLPSPLQQLQRKQTVTARSKKRKFSDLQLQPAPLSAMRRTATTAEMAHDYETPLIPGSVRKKRRLNSSNGTSSVAGARPTNSTNTRTLFSVPKPPLVSNEQRQQVMKRVLNNEFNPSLSLSSTQSPLEAIPTATPIGQGRRSRRSETVDISLEVDICKTADRPTVATSSHKQTTQSPKPQQLSMILDFDTPSHSLSRRSMSVDTAAAPPPRPQPPPPPLSQKKKKRRLSAARDSAMVVDVVIENDDVKEKREPEPDPKPDKPNMENGSREQEQAQPPPQQQQPPPQKQMVSRQKRRKRHSLSSNAIKKSVKQPAKQPTKKLFQAFQPSCISADNSGSGSKEPSPFDVPPPTNHSKTYKRRSTPHIAANTSKQVNKNNTEITRKQVKSHKQVSVDCSTSTSASTSSLISKQASSEPETAASSVNICPLLTNLVEDDRHPSQIAYISYYVLHKVQSQRDVHKQQNILRKLDSFLALLSRAEIILNNDERTRLQQIDSVNKELDVVLRKHCDDASLWSNEWRTIHRGKRKRKKTARNKKSAAAAATATLHDASSSVANKNNKKKHSNKKRVRFCCFDLSTVTTPESGDLDSVKHLQSISRLLVQAAKIGHKLFSIKSKVSLTRKSIAWFLEDVTQYANDLQQASLSSSSSSSCSSSSGSHDTQQQQQQQQDIQLRLRLRVCRYLRQQFEDAYEHRIGYPFSERVAQHLSSLIRFYIKTIWNAAEFIEQAPSRHKNMKLPKWYTQIGTYSVYSDDESMANSEFVDANAEFIPYHAAEITINLQSLYLLQTAQRDEANQSKSVEELMDAFQILDNPFIFFNEMRQVLQNVNGAMLGSSATGNAPTSDTRRHKQKQQKLSKNEAEFIKYLQTKWKELKACLRDITNTKCTRLYFYLPLLDFQPFLHSMQAPPK